MLVAIQLSVADWYLAPLSRYPEKFSPPQMIISLSIHTAV